MGTVNIDIKTQDAQTLAALKRLEREFKGLDTQIDRTSNRGVGLGNVMGGLAIGAGVKYAITEFEDAERTGRKMEAAIIASGNAAGVSADEQRKYADELAKTIAVDNDVVLAAGTRLRAYQAIKGERFHETLAVAADVAAAKEKDLAAVSDQLGKALNSPANAAKILRSLGIALNEQQTEQIKVMTEAGDVAGAQGVILDELKNRYSGAAEANVTDSQRMKVAMDDAAESAGKALAPALELTADMVGVVAGAFASLPVPMQQATFVTGLGVAAWSKLAPVVRSASEAMGGVTAPIGGAAGAMNLATVAALPLGVALLGMGLRAEEAAKNAAIMEAAVTSLTGKAESLGVTVDEVFKTDFLIDAVKIDPKMAEDLEAAGGDLAGFAEAAAGTDEEWNRYKDSLSGGDFDNNALKLKLESMREQLLNSREAANAATGATEELGAATDETADATGRATSAMGDQVRGLGSVTDEITDQVDALHDLNEEMDTAVGLAYELAGAQLSLSGAHDSVQDAQLALGEARTSGDAEAIQRAEDRLTRAMLDEAAAVGDLYEEQQKANGQAVDSAVKADLQRDAMARLKGETGFTNAVIEEFTAALDEAARVRKIQLDTSQAITNLGLLIAELERTKGAFAGIPLVGQQIATGATAAIDLAVNGGRSLPGDTGTTAPPRSLSTGNSVIVNGDLNVGGSKRDLDRAMDRASRNAGRGILVGS